MIIGQDKFVTIQYMFTAAEGELPDFLSKPRQSDFIFGRDQILPALQSKLLGYRAGEELEVFVPASEAFGPYDPDLVNEVSVLRFKDLASLKEGAIYEDMGPNGQPIMFTVRKIGTDSVTIDFNHPAAGKDIVLKVKVLEVREPSFMELMASMNLFRGGG